MKLSDNEVRLLRKISTQGGLEPELFELSEETQDDRDAFPSLLNLGFVRGYKTKTEITVCLTADGVQALREASPRQRTTNWLFRKADLVVENALSHFFTMIIGLFLGWLAKSFFG